MSKSLDEIFQEKIQQVDTLYSNWADIQKKLLQLLNSDETDEINIVKDSDNKFMESIRQFSYEINNPKITLATTGTTSGGKSSLVNLLCGAEIMPVAVQEMSAGTVIINHHDIRSLTIPLVPGLPDEYSGTWTDISDIEIRLRLQKVMDGYRQLREENKEPPAPRIEIQYPTRLGSKPELIGLPSNFNLCIIDLPGFKHIADDHNRNIIRASIKPALCLVTYNSEEPDTTKQKKLLEEVVEQVRNLRGTPSRMLFILNRIDVFRRDLNWEIQTEKFVENTTNKIRKSVGEALPEYTAEAKNLRAQRLSTYPALCAYIALNGPTDYRIDALERIESKFNSLIHSEIIGELSRKVTKWTDNDCQRVAEDVWQSSYGQEFDDTLRKHIYENIPQLLLLHPLKVVIDAANNTHTNSHQIIHAHLNATHERYQNECNRLNHIDQDLQNLREKYREELFKIIHIDEEEYDIIEELTDIANQLQNIYDLPKDSLVPLYDWSGQLGKTIDTFLTDIHKAIDENTEPESNLFESLSPVERQAILNAIFNLRNSGYKDYAKNGFQIKTYLSQEKNKISSIKQALNDITQVLSRNLKTVLDRTAEREAERIQEALQALMEGYAQKLNREAQSIASDVAGLFITPSQLVRIKQKLLLGFNIDADFVVNNEDGEENIEKTFQIEKRLWYTLWIKKGRVEEKKTITVKRNYDLATIPSITAIFVRLINQAKKSRHEVEFSRWLHSQLDEFMAGINKWELTFKKGLCCNGNFDNIF